jgi:hypothetical protein
MDKLKSLLLPLALVFAAIAVFETGARYGATNMRAYAIASELQLPLTIYVQGQASMNEVAKENLAILIDNGIAAGSMHRTVWYLSKDAKAALDKVLAYAFTLRGDGVEARLISVEASENLPEVNKERLAEVRTAVHDAKIELVDNAPSVAEQEAAAEAAKETDE